MTHFVKVQNFTLPMGTDLYWYIYLPHSVDTFDFYLTCNNVPQNAKVCKANPIGSQELQVFSLTNIASGQTMGGRLQKDGRQLYFYCKANAAADTVLSWEIAYNYHPKK